MATRVDAVVVCRAMAGVRTLPVVLSATARLSHHRRGRHSAPARRLTASPNTHQLSRALIVLFIVIFGVLA
jgi:hypothetical protein